MSRLTALLKVVLILLILGTITNLVLRHNVQQRRVLLVHSYNKDLAWVNDINEGVNRALAESDLTGLNLRTHYMDLKNHPNCHFYKNAAADARFTIQDWQPEVVILVDDLAQGLIGFNLLDSDTLDRNSQAKKLSEWLSHGRCDDQDTEYFGLSTTPPLQPPAIVFAGVNGKVDLYGYPQATNVSGIFEHKNYQALAETLQTLIRSSGQLVNHVQMLNDSSPTGLAENAAFAGYDWTPMNVLEPVAVSTFPAWKAAVKKANGQRTMLLIANYQNLTAGDCQESQPSTNCQPIAPGKIIEWTERNARLPVLGANTNFVADGGLMTVAISGTEQGQVAMQLALQRLKGESTTQMLEAKQFVIGMNQSLVRKRKLQLPGIYEAFSREVGQFVDVVEELYMDEEMSIED